MVLLLAVFGCSDTELIRGRALVDAALTGPPVANGEITILQGMDTSVYDQAPLDANGVFEVTGPRGSGIYALLEGDDIEQTAFAGVVGQGTFIVPPGEIYGFSTAAREALDADFSGCSDPGPVVTGEIRLSGASDPDTGESPLITAGYARLVRGDTIVTACFLDDDGIFDPDADVTGDTGRYAIYGAEPGVWTFEYGYFAAGNPIESSQLLYVPESGVAPQFPAWVDLVL